VIVIIHVSERESYM